jgi:NADH dehydrogenase/NADH:ubiquinone oxidoreductase subunit G
MSDKVKLMINGENIIADKGQTLLEAAISNGIDIPNLCYNKKVTHTAACRLCVYLLTMILRKYVE